MQDLQNRDQVYIRNLRRDIIVGKDAWGRTGKTQPLFISLRIFVDKAIEKAARDDDVTRSIDYSELCKVLKRDVHDEVSLVHVAGRVAVSCGLHNPSQKPLDPISPYKLELTLPKAVLYSKKGLIYAWENYGSTHTDRSVFPNETFRIEEIECSCILGINPHERLEKQPVSIDLSFGTSRKGNGQESPSRQILNCYQEVVKTIVQRVEGSAFQTVEALTSFVARIITMQFSIAEVTVAVRKPFAISNVEAPGIQITRTRDFFARENDIWKQSD